MKPEKFDAWVRRILDTEEEEISCSVCFDLLADYVDVEISGGTNREDLKKVEHHLKQCRVCMEEYELLHDLVVSENEGEDPVMGE